MGALNFYPQEAFAPAYYTDPRDIIENRTVFNRDYDFFVDYGGRGGGKTFDKVDAIVVESTIRPIRILVGRELQNSIEESVKAEIEACIEQRDLQDFFKITEKAIVGANGSRFIFKGIKNNINNLKSIADVDVVLIEEAENVSQKSWDKLLPSIRPKSGRAIVIVIFNPANELDSTYQTWIVNTPEKTLLTKVNYYDNKYFSSFLEGQRLHCKKTRPMKEYENIWEGKPQGSGDDVIIQLDWIKAARFASRDSRWVKVGERVTAYDPAGQGRDFHAAVSKDGNIITSAQEWLRSPDLREGTRRALREASAEKAQMFRYDECGGFGDGVSVFVDDATFDDGEGFSKDIDDDGYFIETMRVGDVVPFNAGDAVIDPDEIIFGTAKTNAETYSNAKAQAQGITAQLLYNTFRFIEFGEDVDPLDMLSIDIEDDDLFNKIARELSSPIWVKSEANSKKKVESKKDMEKRTGQPSPNIADSIHMLNAPFDKDKRGFLDVWIEKKKAESKGEEYRPVKERAKRTGSKSKSKQGSGFAGFYRR